MRDKVTHDTPGSRYFYLALDLRWFCWHPAENGWQVWYGSGSFLKCLKLATCWHLERASNYFIGGSWRAPSHGSSNYLLSVVLN